MTPLVDWSMTYLQGECSYRRADEAGGSGRVNVGRVVVFNDPPCLQRWVLLGVERAQRVQPRQQGLTLVHFRLNLSAFYRIGVLLGVVFGESRRCLGASGGN